MKSDPDSPNPRTSIRDIARHLGVSHATVSLALRNNPRISEAVREKVRMAADELGYQPDPMLQALASYRRTKGGTPVSAGLAWINAWESTTALRGFQEFDLYWKGASTAARKHGYSLEEFRLDKECGSNRLNQILTARGICGILLPPQHPHPEWSDFPWERYSVVRFGRSLRTPECHVVTADQVANTMLAFVRLRELGYTRIGFVDSRETTVKRGQMFQAGFLLAQTDVAKSERIPVLDINHAPNSGRHVRVAKWLRQHKVDAILTGLSELPTILTKAGIRVPDDVALAGTTILDTPISAGINQHPEEIGRVGLLMLKSLINDGARGIPPIFRQIQVEGSWSDGDSAPPRR
ncbi:MAG: LacI family DNA-binding transcriptional regulator [Verrucomicrobiae bacterium]|nr:LacI family DNA-binding transcriptional regulator [Verrucomicrobiae bacterium]MCP5544856.1 LacI family DNA-binding transcriptional regulator [Akkermansiaceae bacterium]MCP5547181.1 LacI family DNA-binding transcriptional regulator [Akkermansiaceae bacterium]